MKTIVGLLSVFYAMAGVALANPHGEPARGAPMHIPERSHSAGQSPASHVGPRTGALTGSPVQ